MSFKHIEISPAALVFFAGLAIGGAYLPLAAAILHEGGHLIALALTRQRVERVRIGLPGADIAFAGARSYGAEAFIAAAGGLVNLCAAALTIPFCGTASGMCFLSANLSLAVINLMPALPLDGGVLTRALLSMLLGCDAGTAVTIVMTRLLGFLCLVAASYLLFYGIGGALFLPAAGLGLAMLFEPG